MLSRAARSHSRRLFSTSSLRLTAWSPQPAPPRLPKEEQEIFEQLQKQSMGAFSTPRQPPKINQSPQSSADASSSQSDTNVNAAQTDQGSMEKPIKADVRKGDELHPNVRRGAAPEFDGDTNPDTGEIGGPKNNPIRWQQMEGDWSFNGRVSDF
ncbi:MAG: hypothetical protein Q9162_000922 [Coniocarpon cinnabarinum]